MEYYRTEELRFQNIANFPFKSNYVDIEGLRIHYIDEGPDDFKTVLLLHGVPTWSYLYRNIIPLLVKSGLRVIAPDLAGFGKSDKPCAASWHTLSNHVKIIKNLIIKLDLKDITLFGQDWGAMIGLRLAFELPEPFAGIIISNGGLPTGLEKPPFRFLIWRSIARYSPILPIGQIVNFACNRKLSKAEKMAYRAPFERPKFKIGPRTLPRRVPFSKRNPESAINRQAWLFFSSWKKPFLTVFGNNDPITRGAEKKFQNEIPGAKGQNHMILEAGHFIQEDAPLELAEIMITFIRN